MLDTSLEPRLLELDGGTSPTAESMVLRAVAVREYGRALTLIDQIAPTYTEPDGGGS